MNGPKRPNQKLTPKQQRFAEEYVVDLNATAAYKRAGYKAKNGNVARVEGHRLLTNPNIEGEIRKAQREISSRTEATAENVLRELARIAFSDVRDLFGDEGKLLPIDQIPKDVRRAISSIKVRRDAATATSKAPAETIEYRFWSKDAALERLAKHLGLFQDPRDRKDSPGHPLHGPGKEPIQVEHKQVHLDFDEMLELIPLDVKIRLLEYMRQKKEGIERPIIDGLLPRQLPYLAALPNPVPLGVGEAENGWGRDTSPCFR